MTQLAKSSFVTNALAKNSLAMRSGDTRSRDSSLHATHLGAIPSSAPPHLFDHWPHIDGRLRAVQRIALFLDFDGTLVNIAPIPGRVRLAPSLRRILQDLANHSGITLAVISGRRRAELQRFIRLPKLLYLGLYGWERDAKFTVPAATLAAVSQAQTALAEKLSAYRRVWIEPKHFTFSIHLLGASAAVQRRVRRRVKTFLQPFRNSLRLFQNMRDIEIVPRSIADKGAAVRQLLKHASLRGALPIYFGDDLSDEPAFTAASNGIAILVGKRRPTRAQFFLRSPAEVASSLSTMEALLS